MVLLAIVLMAGCGSSGSLVVSLLLCSPPRRSQLVKEEINLHHTTRALFCTLRSIEEDVE